MALPPNEDRGSRLLALYWTECIIACIVVGSRVFWRLKLKNLGWDDWFMVFTIVYLAPIHCKQIWLTIRPSSYSSLFPPW